MKIIRLRYITCLLFFMITTFTAFAEKEISWAETYKVHDISKPYGTYVIYKLMQDHFPSHTFSSLVKPLHESLPKGNRRKPASYVFIGEYPYYKEKDIDRLLEFVSKGNHAFIASHYLPPARLLNEIDSTACGSLIAYDYFSDSMITVQFLDFPEDSGHFTYKHTLYRHTLPRSWGFLHYGDFCESIDKYESLGYIDDQKLFYFSIPYGEGRFYFHTIPLLFTNYHLQEEKGYDLINYTFNYLKEGDIYWDEYSKYRGKNAHPMWTSRTRFRKSDFRNPLSYILSEGSLKWAFYMMLLTMVLFAVFRAKRTQKPIPVIEPLANTTKEYVEMIGSLYFQQNNHKKLAENKMKLFLGFVRDRYRLYTKEDEPELIRHIAAKADVPYAEVDVIFKIDRVIVSADQITEKTLINFNTKIENFYKKCR